MRRLPSERGPGQDTPDAGGSTTADGTGALAAFAQSFGVASPRAAMLAACDRLRQRVVQAGWAPGLEAYLRAFGLRVFEAPIPTDGRLDYEDGHYVIRVQRAYDADGPRAPSLLRPADATHRQRFTIAHELGHALLLERLGAQPEHLSGLQDPAIWPELERLCDLAAAELLVPLDEFLRAVGQVGCAPRAIERLAEGFRVSSEVILLRFLAAGARSISLWQVHQSPGQDGAFIATVIRSYRAGQAPGLQPATLSNILTPDLVVQVADSGRVQVPRVQVADGGRVQVPRVQVASSAAPWRFAAVADGGLPRAAPSDLVQLGWLDDDVPVAPVAAQPPRLATDAHVTLLLFPESAPADGSPLWAHLSHGSTAPR